MTTAVETAQAKRMPEQPAPMPLPARTGASVAYANPYSARLAARSGVLRGHTSGLCDGYVQANIVMLRDTWANEFLRFCQLNPKPCPLLDVTEPGVPVFRHLGQDVDVRRDVPRYRVYRNGELAETYAQLAEEQVQAALRIENENSNLMLMKAKLMLFRRDYAGLVTYLDTKRAFLSDAGKREADTYIAVAKRLGGIK